MQEVEKLWTSYSPNIGYKSIFEDLSIEDKKIYKVEFISCILYGYHRILPEYLWAAFSYSCTYPVNQHYLIRGKEIAASLNVECYFRIDENTNNIEILDSPTDITLAAENEYSDNCNNACDDGTMVDFIDRKENLSNVRLFPMSTFGQKIKNPIKNFCKGNPQGYMDCLYFLKDDIFKHTNKNLDNILNVTSNYDIVMVYRITNYIWQSCEESDEDRSYSMPYYLADISLVLPTGFLSIGRMLITEFMSPFEPSSVSYPNIDNPKLFDILNNFEIEELSTILPRCLVYIISNYTMDEYHLLCRYVEWEKFYFNYY